MTVNLPFVMNFVIYLTNRCNLACKMCSQYGQNYKENAPKELNISDWEKFFVEISDTNPKPKIILIGGEPLLYKDFKALLKLLEKYNLPVHIVTNGTLLDKYTDILSTIDATITISIDGLHEKHDEIRGKKGTFDKVISNIKLINKMQEQGAKVKLLLNTVILPDNVDDLAKFVEYMQQFNIEQFVFQHLQFSTSKMEKETCQLWQRLMHTEFDGAFFSTKEQYLIDKNYVEKIKRSIDSIAEVCEKEAFVFPYLNDSEMENYYLDKNLDKIRPYLTCTTPWLNAFIGPEGTVSNCIGNPIGNIQENDFWTLWNNEKANKMRNALCQNGALDLCKKCCNFYKENFLLAPNGEITIGDKVLVLPSELNYLKSSPEGVFVLDKVRNIVGNRIPVLPLEVYSKEHLRMIKEKETIVKFFSDIKGEGNES